MNNVDDNCIYIPDEETIREEAEKIRLKWSDKEKNKRSSYNIEHSTIKIISINNIPKTLRNIFDSIDKQNGK